MRAKQNVADALEEVEAQIKSRENNLLSTQSILATYQTQYQNAWNNLSEVLQHYPEWQERLEQGTLSQQLSQFAKRWGDEDAQFQKLTNTIQLLTQEEKTLQERCTEKELICKEKQTQWNLVNKTLIALQQDRKALFEGEKAEVVEKKYTEQIEQKQKYLATVEKQYRDLVEKGKEIEGGIAQITQNILQAETEEVASHQHVMEWLAARSDSLTLEALTLLLQHDNTWVTQERQQLDAMKTNLVQAKATLAERIKNVDEHQKAPLITNEEESKMFLNQMLENISSEISLKRNRYSELNVALKNHVEAQQKVKAYEKELAQKEAIAKNWEDLNSLLGSADGGKFKTMAQGYTLDVLLGYANKHLAEISDRYILERVSPESLSLQVRDLDMLSEVRSVHSLSGGESFLISLALALGLSSLSSNRMRIESLFIDEGFGTLDADTLRVAMDVLERLQTQGRKIGVISHVAEMTERIPCQIKVVKSSHGKSTVLIANTN